MSLNKEAVKAAARLPDEDVDEIFMGQAQEFEPDKDFNRAYNPVQVEAAGPNVDVRQLGSKQYRVSKHAGARKKRAKAKRRRR